MTVDSILHEMPGESAVADTEPQSLLRDENTGYALHIFKIMRSMEFGDSYRPFLRERKKAQQKLNAELGENTAGQMLKYCIEGEKKRYTLDIAADDERFNGALETLRGLETPPLMAELPEETAFILWHRGGSWAGALLLAGFSPLSKTVRHAAIKNYRIENASLELLPDDIAKKMDTACAVCMGEVLDKTRKSGNFPSESELQKYYKPFKARGLMLRKCLIEVGLEVPPAKRGTPNPDAPVMLRNGTWMWPPHMKDNPQKRAEYMAERKRKKAEEREKRARIRRHANKSGG